MWKQVGTLNIWEYRRPGEDIVRARVKATENGWWRWTAYEITTTGGYNSFREIGAANVHGFEKARKAAEKALGV